MTTKITLACALLLALSPLAAADDAEFFKEKLGEGYAAAAPEDKLVLISEGHADKKFQDSKDREKAQGETDAVVMAEVVKGKDSKEKLMILGKLRKAAEEKIKALSAERRKEKRSYVSFREPSRDLQIAVAVSYVIDAAGPAPTLDKLGCLKDVREATSWSYHSSVVLAYAQEALARDEAYGKADHEGKLAIIKKLSEDQGALTDQERKYLDQAVLADLISVLIKGGKSPGDALLVVEDLKKRKLICWFASTWAEGFIKELGKVR